MYHDKLVYKAVIWVFCFYFISLWKEKEALKNIKSNERIVTKTILGHISLADQK